MSMGNGVGAKTRAVVVIKAVNETKSVDILKKSVLVDTITPCLNGSNNIHWKLFTDIFNSRINSV